MKTIVITGGTGFVGGHIIKELLENGQEYFPNEKVQVINVCSSEKSLKKLDFTLRNSKFSSKDVDSVYVDMTDVARVSEVVKEADYVIHTAAIVELNGNEGEVIVQQNVTMTQNVVTACLESVRKPVLVHLSSIATLGSANECATVKGSANSSVNGSAKGSNRNNATKFDNKDAFGGSASRLITEDCTFDNIVGASYYSRSKFLSENAVWSGISQGLRAAIIMPSLILGDAPKGQGIQPLISFARQSLGVYFNSGTGFVDVRDVARSALTVATNPKAYGSRYIISERNMSYRDFFALYSKHGKRPWLKMPLFMLYIGLFFIKTGYAILGHKAQLSFSMLSMLKEAKFYDGSKITRDLGFEYKFPLTRN